MISKADFEELFPATFRSEEPNETRLGGKLPSDDCITRWEDDGGRTLPVSWRNSAESGPGAESGYDIWELVRVTAMAITMSVAGVYGAAWTMHATYNPITRA